MKKVIFLFAAALMMIACSNDELAIIDEVTTNDDVQYITEFTADFGGANSRMTATHTPGGLDFDWRNADMLYVSPAESVGDYQTYIFESSTGKFKLGSGSTGMVAGNEYFAINKFYNLSYTVDENGFIKVHTYHSYQDPVSAVPLISDVFVASAEGTLAPMHHTVGVVEVPVKLTAESSYTLQNLGFNVRDGGATEYFYATPTPTTEGGYFIEPTDVANKFVNSYKPYANIYRLNKQNKHISLSATKATSIFVPMLPGTHTIDKLLYQWNWVSYEIPFEKTITVVRGKITKLEEVALTF